MEALDRRELLGQWEGIRLVHLGLCEFLLDLRLEDIEFAFHVFVDVVEPLLQCVEISMLSFFVGESWHHVPVVLLYLQCKVVAAVRHIFMLRAFTPDPPELVDFRFGLSMPQR